jgi:transposase
MHPSKPPGFNRCFKRRWPPRGGTDSCTYFRNCRRHDFGQGYNKKTYRRRNIIERCFGSLKWFRRLATRYEKLATHCLGMVTLAIIFHLLG